MEENKLGEVITRLRKEKGLTQKDLADKLNISDKAVSRWETGGSSPNMDMLLRISKFFKVSLNDLIAARVATEENGDELVQEIIKEFTEINKKNSKRIKALILSAVTIVLILTIAIIFTHTFNRFKVYRINIESDEIYSVMGVYVETRIKDTLHIGDLKFKSVEISDTDIVSVDLYYLEDDKEYILQSYSSLKNISFVNYQSYIEIEDLSNYADKLYLKISILDSKGYKTVYTGKLEFVLDFSNNKIFYKEDTKYLNTKSISFTPDEIKSILLENGFVESSNNVFIKEDNKYKINYLYHSNKISINYESNNLSHRYTYCLNNNILEVLIFDENNLEIENYKYDVTNDILLECITGRCNNYKNALSVLNENVLNLLYEN